MRYVLTLTGSIYEIDEANKQVRRLSGKDAKHRSANGEWKTYSSIYRLSNGRMAIVWGVVSTAEELVVQTLQTSPVVKEASSISELVEVN